MSINYLIENKAFNVLREQLLDAVQQLRSGMDVSPAQCSRLEGMAAALIATGSEIEMLAEACIAAGEKEIVVTRDGDRLHFHCWQQRAPVYPST